jgi:uncharacterized alkaline shock family protein YloU
VAGEASISTEILARYAADAAREAAGVRRVSRSPIPGRRGARVTEGDDGVRVELHLAVDWGASIPEVGADVQRRVSEYLQSMADVQPAAVDVVVDAVGPRR